MTSDTVSAAIAAHLETARESKAPKLLGDCVSELATVLLASHPRAIALCAISGDAQQGVYPPHRLPSTTSARDPEVAFTA